MGRRLAAVVLVLSVTVAVAGCGSGQDEPVAGPVTPTADPTPTEPDIVFPTPTPSYPLSDMEDEPVVQALRRSFAALSRVHNAGTHEAEEYTDTLDTEFADGAIERMRTHYGEYLAPGPFPFTPVEVEDRQGERWLYTCEPVSGWWIDRRTGERDGPWEVAGAAEVFAQRDGKWLRTASYTMPDLDCSEVEVQELPW